jgi:uncharacterized protein (TIGR02246 family)
MMREGDTDAVLAVESAYDAAWNAGDVDGLAKCFTEDAILVNPRGGVAIGAAAIRDQLRELHEGPARGSRHASVPERVSFISPDIAVIDGEARVTGAAGLGARKHRFTDVLVRRNGRWAIAHVRAYVYAGEA